LKSVFLFGLLSLVIVNAIVIPGKPVKPLTTPPKDSQNCALCQWAVAKIELYLKDNQTDAEIVESLDQACSIFVDTNWVSECQSMVSQFAPAIIDYIVSSGTPDQVCATLKLCNSSRIDAFAVTANPFYCTACTFVTQQVENYLEANHTESEILVFLEKDCDVLGVIDKKLVAACQAVVEQYGPTIIQMLINKESPDTICTQIGLCNSTLSAAVVVVPPKETGTEDCVICAWAVGQIEKYVQANHTETEIMTFLVKDCNLLVNKKVIAECQSLVSVYGPDVINLVISQEDPQTVCSQVKLCDDSFNNKKSVVN